MIDRRHTMPPGGGARSPRSVRSTHPTCFGLLTPSIFLLATFIFLLSSCTSPTPPPPPPPPAGPDTTSHDFIWQIDTLGDGNSSVLYDVAIINDTTIWAVGEIYLKDSTGQVDPTAYNLARWNGSSWSLNRVPLRDFGSPTFGYYPIRAVLAFSSSDVWVADAGGLAHFDGHNWGRWTLLFSDLNDPTFGATNRMCGFSRDDIYIVGNRGSISHFDGTIWRRIESGTTLPINDVWGSFRSEANQTEIIAVCADKYQDLGRKILRITPSGVEALSDSGLPWSLSGIWFASDGPCYAVGAGIASISDSFSGERWSVPPSGEINAYYSFAVRGNASNDVVVAGAYGEIVHFNGSTWRNYLNDTGSFFGNLYGVAQRGRTVVAVGAIPQRAIVIIGRR